MSSTPRNAKQEAQERLDPDGGSARVLEPSPPTVATEPFFADDPVEPTVGDGDGLGPVVLPTGLATGNRESGAPIDWDTWRAGQPDDDDLDAWLADHWLGGRRRLPPAPPLETLVETRLALHRLAMYVIAPVRHRANGKFGLRWTHRGFGTPFFGDDRQVRVEGATIVDQHGDDVRRTAITTLRAASEFLSSEIDPETAAEHDSPEVGDIDETLMVDAVAADFLGAWYGMAFAALEAVRSDEATVNPSRPQLWPGHFDPAIEIGGEDSRGSYGASPGGHGSDEPYLYGALWYPDRLDIDPDDPFWNGSGFVGRRKKLSDFGTDIDPVTEAADFWRETRDRLSQ